MAPLFNVGLFLPSGVKLAEGAGSSKSMAEHRAAVNALLSLFLVRGDVSRSSPQSPLSLLPTTGHANYPFGPDGELGVNVAEKTFRGRGFGGLESNVENSKRGRYPRGGTKMVEPVGGVDD